MCMKTLHALSLVGLLSCGAVAAIGFTGCSSSSDGGGGGDVDSGGVDVGGTDTTPAGDTAPKDTGKVPGDTAPVICDKTPLDSTFKCAAPTAVQKGGPPATSCTEDMLQEYATKCLTADLKIGSTCGDFKAAHPECATCIANWSFDTLIPGKIYPDRDKCFYKVMDDTCGTAFNCMFACDTAVCGDCDNTAGTGADGVVSEQQDCVNRERKRGGTTVPKGACYDVAAGVALKCLSDDAAIIDPCVISELFTPTGAGGKIDLTSLQRESVIFMRGACRDNGNWTNSSSTCTTPPCDAGPTDAGSDSATTDTGTDAADATDGG